MKEIFVITAVVIVILFLLQHKKTTGERNKDVLTVENFERLKDFIVKYKSEIGNGEEAEIDIVEQRIMLDYSVNAEMELIHIRVFDQKQELVLSYTFDKTKDNHVDVWAIQKMTPKKLKKKLLKNLDKIEKPVRT